METRDKQRVITNKVVTVSEDGEVVIDVLEVEGEGILLVQDGVEISIPEELLPDMATVFNQKMADRLRKLGNVKKV